MSPISELATFLAMRYFEENFRRTKFVSVDKYTGSFRGNFSSSKITLRSVIDEISSRK